MTLKNLVFVSEWDEKLSAQFKKIQLTESTVRYIQKYIEVITYEGSEATDYVIAARGQNGRYGEGFKYSLTAQEHAEHNVGLLSYIFPSIRLFNQYNEFNIVGLKKGQLQKTIYFKVSHADLNIINYLISVKKMKEQIREIIRHPLGN